MAETYAGTAGSRHAYDMGVKSGMIPPPPAQPRGVNPSCFGTLEAAQEHAYAARARIERLADRLVGCVPECGDATASSGANGMFDAATQQALNISENMQRINNALDRIESQLP